MENLDNRGRLTFVLRIVPGLTTARGGNPLIAGTVQCIESGRRGDVGDCAALTGFIEQEIWRLSEEHTR